MTDEAESIPTVPPEVAQHVSDMFPSLADGAKASVIFARGAFAFRFGPMSLKQAGEALTRAQEEGIPCALTIQGGEEIDWNTALALFGKGPGAGE